MSPLDEFREQAGTIRRFGVLAIDLNLGNQNGCGELCLPFSFLSPDVGQSVGDLSNRDRNQPDAEECEEQREDNGF